MTKKKPQANYKLKMPVDKTIELEPAELEASYVARFHDLVDDPNIFVDIHTKEGQRRHFHVISENNHLGPAPITTPHNFHFSYIEVPPGNGANLHAHSAPEIFIPITGKFALIYGRDGQHSVELDPLDTISVPAGLVRTFRNIGKVNGILMVIYDGPGEVLSKIYVDQTYADSLRRDNPALAEAMLA